MRSKDQILLEGIYERILLNEMPLYHSGPKKITIDNVNFDMGAMGFHVGTADQANFRTIGNKNSKMSMFEIYTTTPDGKLSIHDINRDMPWEHADGLIIELVLLGIIDKTEALNLLHSWNDLYSDHVELIEDLIEQAYIIFDEDNTRKLEEFNSAEEIPNELFLSSDTYKNKKKLNDIRLLLIKNRTGAIKYPNEVEGEGYSFVILDKRMIAPKDAKVIVGIMAEKKEADNIFNGIKTTLKKYQNLDKYIGKEIAINEYEMLTDLTADIFYNANIVGYLKIGKKINDSYPIISTRRIAPITSNTNPNIVFHVIGNEIY